MKDLYANRNFGLDLMRFIAVTTVVWGHGENLLGGHLFARQLYQYFEIDGVPLFFVLSGFLIGGILLKLLHQGNFTYKALSQFWLRRWFRTLPNYFLFLTGLTLFSLYIHQALPWSQLWKFFFFLQNFNRPQLNFFDVSWSLTVEEWFYLIVPLCLFFGLSYFRSSTQRVVFVTIVSIITLTTLFRIYRTIRFDYWTIGLWDQNLRKEVITRLDSIMLGFLGAYYSFYKKANWFAFKKTKLAIGCALILGPNLYFVISSQHLPMPILNYVVLTSTPLGALLLLPQLSSMESSTWKYSKIVTFISIVSYSIYLVHEEVVRKIILPKLIHSNFVHEDGMASIASLYVLYWTLSIFLSYLIYKYFERPMTHLRDKFTSV